MKKILAIDDQKDNLITIEAVIKSHMTECKVFTALSGSEGLEIAINKQPDVILLDIIMPGMDGYEVCKRLKEGELTKHIPVVMITAIRTDSKSRVKGLNIGADAFLSKPIDPVELSAQINVMLRIKEAEDKLRAEKDLLEDAVAERTFELKESEEKYKAIYNNAPLAYQSLDESGCFLDVNPKWLTVLGYKQEEVIGKCFGDFLHPDWKPHFKENFSVFKGVGFVHDVQFKIKHKEGHYLDVSFEGYCGHNPDGSFKQTYCVFQDITKRKRTEQIQKVLYNISNAVNTTENLEELMGLIQKELGAIIDTTNFYIALYDRKTDTLSLPYYTDEKDNFTSVPAGKTLTKYVIETRKSLLADIGVKKRFVKEGLLVHVGSLSKVWLGVPLKIEGEVIGVCAVQSYTDENAYTESDMKMLEFISHQISISIQRKKAEDDLNKALVKATESDRLKSTFLANVSHEIRTPMNGIVGFIDLLSEPSLTGDEHLAYINIINKSSDRMLSTINDLINISMVDSDQMTLVNTEMNVNDQLECLYAFCKPEVDNKGVQLFFKSTLPANEATISTDADKFYSIITNLVTNAIKFTNEGYVEFGYNLIPAFELVEKNKDGELVEPAVLEFFVKDTGIGIPKDRQHAIFDRFVQADLTLARRYEGAGLGLSIAKAYTEMLGGKIWVESTEADLPDGKPGGTQFYFTIPYNPVTIEMIESKVENYGTEEGYRPGDLKILIVDDEEIADQHLTIVVENISKETLHATTGTEAVEICRNNPDINLVLMDIRMPEMNGYEATRRIREFNNDVIIIAQTAYALAGDREKVMKAGCNDYISKPIKAEILIEKIKGLIKK